MSLIRELVGGCEASPPCGGVTHTRTCVLIYTPSVFVPHSLTLQLLLGRPSGSMCVFNISCHPFHTHFISWIYILHESCALSKKQQHSNKTGFFVYQKVTWLHILSFTISFVCYLFRQPDCPD